MSYSISPAGEMYWSEPKPRKNRKAKSKLVSVPHQSVYGGDSKATDVNAFAYP